MPSKCTSARLVVGKLWVMVLLGAVGLFISATTPQPLSATSSTDAPHGDFFAYLPLVANNYCANSFFDDFSDPDSGWYIGDDGNIRWQYLNDQYSIEIYQGSWWTGVPAPRQASGSYTLQVEVNKWGSYGPVGLMFDLADDWSEFYVFVVHPDSFFRVMHYAESQPEPWTTLAAWNPSIIATNFQLKVERSDTQASLYLNSQFITTVTGLIPVSTKRVGVFASSFLPGYPTYMDARFDNFRLCGAANPQADQTIGTDLSLEQSGYPMRSDHVGLMPQTQQLPKSRD